MALIVRDPDKSFEVCDADLEGVEDGDKETFYTVRPLTRDKILEIEARHTKKVPNKVTHQRDSVLDTLASSEDKLDWIVVDWRGVQYENGAPVPCTRETKLQAIGGARQIALFRAADVNRVDQERRAQSFRATADVG